MVHVQRLVDMASFLARNGVGSPSAWSTKHIYFLFFPKIFVFPAEDFECQTSKDWVPDFEPYTPPLTFSIFKSPAKPAKPAKAAKPKAVYDIFKKAPKLDTRLVWPIFRKGFKPGIPLVAKEPAPKTTCDDPAPKTTCDDPVEAKDQTRTCRTCTQEFVFTAGEQVFYSSKGLQEPARCRDCRKAKSKGKGKGKGKGQVDVKRIRSRYVFDAEEEDAMDMDLR